MRSPMLFAKFAKGGVSSEARLEECRSTIEQQRWQIAEREGEIIRAHHLLDELLGQGREAGEDLSERILKLAILSRIDLFA